MHCPGRGGQRQNLTSGGGVGSGPKGTTGPRALDDGRLLHEVATKKPKSVKWLRQDLETWRRLRVATPRRKTSGSANGRCSSGNRCPAPSMVMVIRLTLITAGGERGTVRPGNRHHQPPTQLGNTLANRAPCVVGLQSSLCSADSHIQITEPTASSVDLGPILNADPGG